MGNDTAKARTDDTQKRKVGQVVSISGDKTIRVDVMNVVRHSRYQKYVRRRTRLSVHDEHNKAGVGDMVEVIPTRPLSKNKSHRLLRVVRAAETETAG